MWLPPEAEAELWQELAQLEGEKKMQYISSLERLSIQNGMEQGLEQGRQEGALYLLLPRTHSPFRRNPGSRTSTIAKVVYRTN